MPAVGITDGPPPCARDHWPSGCIVLSCSHLARRWVARERRSAWLVVDPQVKACSRETHSSSRASKTYGHNAFQTIHIHATVINSGRAHTTQHRTHCGLWLRLQSWLMQQSPHRLWNDLKCVEWDVNPCSIKSIRNPTQTRIVNTSHNACHRAPKSRTEYTWQQLAQGSHSPERVG